MIVIYLNCGWRQFVLYNIKVVFVLETSITIIIKNCNDENKEQLETFLLNQLTSGSQNSQPDECGPKQIVKDIVEVMLNGKNITL